MIHIQNLTKRYNGTTVYQDWSCTIPDGITYLLGPNGSGKRTLLRCIARYTKYAGTIHVSDPIAYLPEIRKWEEDWRICDFFNFLHELARHSPTKEWCNWATRLAIDPANRQQLNACSKGTLNKIYVLGLLTDLRPTILFDEPTDAFDLDSKQVFLSILADLAANRTVLVSTHDASIIYADAPSIIRL